MAYGLLALKPWEFERLQPYEYQLLVEGAVWRMERREEIAAYFVSSMMNPHLKKPIRPQALIAPLRGSRQTKEDREYFKKEFGLA